MKEKLLFLMLLVGMLAVGRDVQSRVDVTDQYVVNADLSVDPASEDNGWVLDNGWRQNWIGSRNADHVNVVEFYAGWNGLERTAYGMRQTISLPAGNYRLAVNAFYRHGDYGDGTNKGYAYIYAGEKKQNVYALLGSMDEASEAAGYNNDGYTGDGEPGLGRASNAFYQGKFSNEFDFTMDSDGDIEIGFAGTFDLYRSWIILGPVKLYRYTLDDYIDAYNEKVKEAKALLLVWMSASAVANLNAAIKDASSFTTVDEVTAATQSLNQAINIANNSIQLYIKIGNTIEQIKDIEPDLDYTAIDDAYYNGTLESVDELMAMLQKMKIAQLGTSPGTDYTSAIINPSFEQNGGSTFGWTYAPSIDSGAKQIYDAIYTVENADGDYVFNIWSSGNTITQTIEGLPDGQYLLTALIASDAGNQVNLIANEKTVPIDASSDGKTIGVRGEVLVEVSGGSLTIGAEGGGEWEDENGNLCKTWYKVDDFRLIYKPKPVSADSTEKVAPEGWRSVITNGNLAGDDVSSFFSKEAPSSAVVGATIVSGDGKNGSRGIVVRSADSPNDSWDTQFWIRLDEPLTVGTKLHVEFDYKASIDAMVSTQAHGEPGSYQHWLCIGDVNFTTSWQTFSTDIEVSSDMAGSGGLLSIAFNLSEESFANEYYFDNFGVWTQITEPADEWTDLIVNGDMEGDDAQCFYVTEQGLGGPYLANITDGIGMNGSRAIKVQSADNPAQDWDTQFFIRLPYQLPAGTNYRVSFDYKADKTADFYTYAFAEPTSYIHWSCIGTGSFSEEWQTYTKEGTITSDMSPSGNMQTIAFLLALNKEATQFIFDNIVFEIPADVAATLTLNPSNSVETQIKAAPDGWKNLITNGNLAGDDVSSFFSREMDPYGPVVGATIVPGAGKNGSRGIVVNSADNPEEVWDTQFWIRLDEALNVGTKLHVEFDYRANQTALASTQAHGEPSAYQYWQCIGDVKFTTSWKTFSKDMVVSSDMAGSDGFLSIAFNLSEESFANEYYFDNFGVWAQTSGIPTLNVVVNGNCASDDCIIGDNDGTPIYSMTCKEYGKELRPNIEAGAGVDGSRGCVVNTVKGLKKTDENGDEVDEDSWAVQFFVTVNHKFATGEKYYFKMQYRADKEAEITTEAHALPQEYLSWGILGNFNATPEWQTLEKNGIVTEEQSGMQTITFTLYNLKDDNTYYFDNIEFYICEDDATEEDLAVAERVKQEESDVAPCMIDASDWMVLKEVYVSNDGDSWIRQWQFGDKPGAIDQLPGITTKNGQVVSIDLSGNNLSGSFPLGLLSLPSLERLNISDNNLSGDLGIELQGYVETHPDVAQKLASLNVSNNQLSGNLGEVCSYLPKLTALDASNNCFEQVLPAISPNVTSLNIGYQNIKTAIDLNLSTFTPQSFEASIPSIILYDHESQTYNFDNLYFWVNSNDGWKSYMSYNNNKVEFIPSYNSQRNAYYGESGDILNLQLYYYPYFECPLKLSFEQGDGNFDGQVNILDLQTNINFIFEEYSNHVFNFTAANLWKDDMINVQDVVCLVDKLLSSEDAGDNPTAGSRKMIPEKEVDAEASVYCKDGKLIVNTSKAVAAFDITVTGADNILLARDLQQMGMTCTVRKLSSGVRIIGYSMSGGTLPVGETALGSLKQGTVSHAMLSTASAEAITVSLGADYGTTTKVDMANSSNDGNKDAYRLSIGRDRAIVIGANGKKTMIKDVK